MSIRQKIENFDQVKLQEIIYKSKSYTNCLSKMDLGSNFFRQYIPNLKEKIKRENLIIKFIEKYPEPNLNVNYFKNIDTKQKAYWLGFIAADGYIKPNFMTLQLGTKDRDWLLQFIHDIKGNPDNVTVYKNKKTKRESYRQCYTVRSKLFSQHIINLGYISPKTFNLKLPNFNNEELNLAFLMGFFDGDGNEGDTSLCCGSKKFLLEIVKRYKLKYEIKKKSHTNVYKLTLGSPLFKKLLRNYEYSMPRKRKTYQHQKNDPVYNISKIPIEDKNKIQQLIKTTSFGYIKKMYNCHSNTVKRYCIKNNIPFIKHKKYHTAEENNIIQEKRRLMKKPLEYSFEKYKNVRIYDYELIYDMYLLGLTYKDINVLLHIPKRRFYEILKKMKKLNLEEPTKIDSCIRRDNTLS